jgi:transcriptional regulator with XRE-family HTH domain
MDRATVAKIEQGGTRATNLSVEDLLALAVALGVNPVELFVPRGESQILKVGQTNIGSVEARRWLRQQEPLRGADSRVYLTERPDREWNELAAEIAGSASVTANLTVTGDRADTDGSDE